MNLPLEPSEEPRSLIEAIRKRPALFMGCKSLRSLRDFMGGYLMALSQHRIEGDTNFSFVPRDFHDWIAYRTHFKESTSGWCNMIIATSGSEEEAFDRFFELAEEHAAREPKVVAVLKDKGGYYDRGDGPTAFPARIPLVVYTDDPGFLPRPPQETSGSIPTSIGSTTSQNLRTTRSSMRRDSWGYSAICGIAQSLTPNEPRPHRVTSESPHDLKRSGEMLRHLLLATAFTTLALAEDPSPTLSLPEMPEPALGPDSMPKEGVPKGTVTTHVWKDSKVFPGTIREYSVYTPAQYDPAKPCAVMIFQDGHSYLNPTGECRATVVFDNLIHAKEIPPIIGIFINPGHLATELPKEPWKSSNRSVEYDTLSDAYARFLLEEILPEVAKTKNLATDPEQRAICGMSSGGICAWTVAWQRPEAFRKVVSHIGSFTNIRGGDVYPGLIRKADKKPIRAFFQEGIGDLDNGAGSWPLANMQMQAAFKFKGYDHRFVWGHGQHSGKHGGAIFPDTLRWLWR